MHGGLGCAILPAQVSTQGHRRLITGAGLPIQVGAFHSALVTFTMFEAAYYGAASRSRTATTAQQGKIAVLR
jgi:hypothetical protein